MVKLAAIQLTATSDVERNLRKAAQFLEVAAKRGARLACFPELFLLPWFPRERKEHHFALAEPVDGPILAEVSDLAKRYGVAVVCPFFERTATAFFNSAAVFDAGGALVGTYRKVHVPDLPLWEERYYFTPGDLGFPVFEVDGLRVGVQLCWDMFFPEAFRCLALAGAQVVCVPTAAAFASQPRWLAMGVSHAVANGIFVLRVNRVGKEPQQDFYGGSYCAKPDGDLATEPIGMNEGVLMVDCEPDDIDRARLNWPFLKDRRPREYASVVGIEWGPGLLDRAAAALRPSRPEQKDDPDGT